MLESLIRRPQDAVFGWVATVSFAAVSLFILDAFYPLAALLGGTVLWALIWILLFGKGVPCETTLSGTDLKFLLLIIAVGLVFRIGPYPYVVGGQDQGVYVNMSYSYDREHGAFHIDPVRSQLKDSELRGLYDAANLRETGTAIPGFGTFLPGVYVWEREESEYVFQFYHLHPLWMSMFGSVLGGLNRLYALTFFSLLSLVAFYLLTLELFEKRSVAFLAAFLLAVNPLHAFFSKFPVTEVVALTFTTSGFYYLIRYHKRTREGNHEWRDLLLSAMLLGGMFFTRISGFMYLPTIWLVLLMVFAYEEDRRIRKWMVAWCFGVGLLYAASVAYGLLFSFPYSRDIYWLSFGRLLGAEWLSRLPILILLSAIVTAGLWLLLRNEGPKQRVRRFLDRVRTLLPWAFILVGILGLVKVYQLAWGGGEFSEFAVSHWDLAGKGLGSVLRSSLVVAGMYVSPPLALFAITGLFSRTRSRYYLWVLVFLLQFVVYIAFLQWLIPYQYYYARYLLTEVIPFSILVAMGGLLAWWAHPLGKKLAAVLLVAATGYFLFFTVLQWQGREAEGAYEAIEEIIQPLDEDDLVFVKRGSFQHQTQIRTPLVYLFDKRVVMYDNVSTVVRYFEQNSEGGGGFGEFFILSLWKIESESLELVSETVYREGHFEMIPVIPIKFSHDTEFPLFLYKIDDKGFGLEKMREWVNLSLVKEGFYDDGVWTKGSGTLTGFRVKLADMRFIVLETYGWNPFRFDAEKLDLRISVGDHVLLPHHQEGFRYFFEIPPGVKGIQALTIHSSTFVPKQQGINADGRRLGIDFKSITFE